MDIKFHYRTVEDDIIVDQVDSPEIVDDFELGQDEAVDIKDKEVNKQKLRKRIDQFKVSFKNFIVNKLYIVSSVGWDIISICIYVLILDNHLRK